MQSFQANLIKNIKDHICLSKSSDFEVQKEMTEYSDKDEKLATENDKLLSELHNIIEKNRNNKQAVLEKIKTKLKQDFEKYVIQARKEKQSPDNFEIIFADGTNQTKPLTKEKFIKVFLENPISKIKTNLECHKVSYENFEAIYNNRKHLFLDMGQKQNELVSMLENVDFGLSLDEKVLFSRD